MQTINMSSDQFERYMFKEELDFWGISGNSTFLDRADLIEDKF